MLANRWETRRMRSALVTLLVSEGLLGALSACSLPPVDVGAGASAQASPCALAPTFRDLSAPAVDFDKLEGASAFPVGVSASIVIGSPYVIRSASADSGVVVV